MYWGLLKKTVSAWSADKVPRLAASLSYYTLFSLAPLFLIVISIAGLFFSREDVRNQLFGQIGGLVGGQGTQTIENMVRSAQHPAGSILASIIGTVVVLVGASGIFGQLKSSVDSIWQVPEPTNKSLLDFIRHNFLPYSMVLGTGFLLLVSLILTTLISAFGHYLENVLPYPGIILQIVNTLISLGLVTLLFAFIYKILPDIKIEWRDVWGGAFLAAILFTIGKFAIGYYIGRGSVLSAFGASGSVVVILLWVYYSAQILFFGAEFCKVYAHQYGSLKDKKPNNQTSAQAKFLGYFIKGIVDKIRKDFT